MKLRLLVIVVLILAGAAAVLLTLGTATSQQQEYNQALDKARAYADDQIPYMAVQWYRTTVGLKNQDEGVYREYLAQSRLLGDSFYKSALNGYISAFPDSAQAYEDVCEFQYAADEYSSAIQTAREAGRRGVASARVQEIYYDCFYRYRYLRIGLDEPTRYLGQYARVCMEGYYGIIDQKGAFIIQPQYLDLSELVGQSIAAKDEEECYIMNRQGFKIARTSSPVDTMSYLSEGRILISRDGMWSYTTTSLAIPEQLPFDEASNFRGGIAAVKKNGKWALIDTEGRNITDFRFDDILLDEFGTCICNGVVFAQENGAYYMLDAAGTRISEQGFENARPFAADNAAAAVCVNGLWGFADNQGNMLISPRFSDARSFCIGLAPVCVDGSWGYISTKGDFRIAPAFTDAMPFSNNGIAAVQESGVWNLILLQGYDN